MQPLDLNLASRPFKNNTLPWVACLGSSKTSRTTGPTWSPLRSRVQRLTVGLQLIDSVPAVSRVEACIERDGLPEIGVELATSRPLLSVR